MKKNLQDYRRSYEKSQLLEENLPAQPLELFNTWFHEAEEHPQVSEVNMMSLSSISLDGFPKSRIVLLKAFGPEGFVFYTNYTSEKGKAILANPKVCLLFFWPPLERQVIIKGIASKTTEDDSGEYFKTRPRGSQLGALASSQSSRIASREVLEARLEELKEKYHGKPVPKPEEWGGYVVKPESMEFWQGRANRLHDRILYRQEEAKNWNIDRLAP